MRRQLRDRTVGPRHRHHRHDREIHHRHRVGQRLGQTRRAGAERSESVGIIGGGPGGLAAADMLRRAGIQVTVYDRYDRAGGLLMYGIPGFKLEKDIVQRRNDLLADGGVEFVLNCDVDATKFEEIRAKA